MISWIQNRIRIRINMQITSQNVWNMSLFEHFFKGLSLYLDPEPQQESRIRTGIRIRIRIRVIRIPNTVYY